MQFDNIRYGFATNSSSTHSLAIWKDGRDVPAAPEPDTFGWEWFTANTEEAKAKYVRSLFMKAASGKIGEEAAVHLASLLWGQDREKLAREFQDVYVDHDSDPYFPLNWSGEFLDMNFVMEFYKVLQNPKLAILGGNDNEENPGAFDPGYETITQMGGLFGGWGKSVARKDEKYGHWTLFDRSNGRKVRIRLDETMARDAKRSTLPELVDIKITDYCPFGCSFCYQGSTKEGKHANIYEVLNTLNSLAKLQVFEVAFGGGEPTLHPDFVRIMTTARYLKVVPNFTTRNLGWLKDETQRDNIIEAMGAFAYSVDTPADILRLKDAIKDIKELTAYDSRRVTVQYVVGQDVEEKALRDILMTAAEARIPITLLGYKTTGRGAAFGEKPCPRWVDIIAEIRKEKYLQVGIDTVLADRGRERLIERGLDPVCLAPTEGTFSCYIDSVTGRMHRSSYDHSEGTPISAMKTHTYKSLGVYDDDCPAGTPQTYTREEIDADTVFSAWEKVRLQ